MPAAIADIFAATRAQPAPELCSRDLPDGRWATCTPMAFGNVRLLVSESRGSAAADDAWCYDGWDRALAAMAAWDPLVEDEPAGWKRHPRTGRRRTYEGEAYTEVVIP